MMTKIIPALAVIAATLWALPSAAGPCAQDIEQMQIKVDAKIDEIAGSGPSAPESRAALLHHQPTPGSIAAAEEKLGEGAGMRDALDALARARTADAAGDESACRQALADAERTLSQ